MLHAPGKHCFMVLAAVAAYGMPLAQARAYGATPKPPALAADQELQIATGAMHRTLVAYSRLLSDLIAAYHVALAQGQLPRARSITPIDPRLRHRLHTLSERAEQIIPASALPPLPRVYHARALAALQALGAASTLGDLLAPSQALLAALGHLQEAERDLVVANAEAQAPKPAEVDPVWAGPIDEALARLTRLVALMAEAPRPLALDAQVELDGSDPEAAISTLRWSRPPATQAAGLRLSLCRQDGGPEGSAPVCTEGIDPEVGRWAEPLGPDAWHQPPRYAITTVSPFGVHSRPHEHRAKLTGGPLRPATRVAATSLAPSAESPDFYRLVDAVAVSWKPSLSDADLSDWDETMQVHAPHRLSGYDIYRLNRAQAQTLAGMAGPQLVDKLAPFWVGFASPGSDQFIDRPALKALAAGITYVVVATAPDGAVGVGPLEVTGPSFVEVDLAPSWQLAAHGARVAHQPLLWETRRAEVLRDPAALSLAQERFHQLGKVAQRALWEGFWRSVAATEREGWRRLGAELYSVEQRQALRVVAPEQLTEAGLHAAQLALYIGAHRDVWAAIEQHWALLDDAGKRRARAQRAGSASAGAWPGAESFEASGMTTGADWPLQVAAWWRSRDAAQVAAVASWWHDLPPAVQAERLGLWLGNLPDDVVGQLVWPPWEALSSAERQAWLNDPPKVVPAALWPRFLAHIDYQALPLKQRVRAVRADVGPTQSFLAQACYWLRPVDKLLNFNLTVALTFLGLGLLSGYLLGYCRVAHEGHDFS